MKKAGRLILFGFLLWLTIMSGAMALSGIRESDRTFFETLMGPVLVTSTIAFTLIYFRRVASRHFREAGLLSAAFVLCNIILDLPMFMAGPMEMPFSAYFKDIGLAYLSMPMIVFGISWQAQRTSCG